MSDETPQSPQPGPRRAARRSRLLRIALIWSLAVNLLVLGLVGGAVVNFRRGGDEPVSRIDGPNPFLRALTREDARKIRRAMEGQVRDLAHDRDTARESMQAVLRELRSASFSPEALRAHFDLLAQSNARRAAIGTDAIIAHLTTLDARARADFADRLEAALRRGPRGGRPGPDRH